MGPLGLLKQVLNLGGRGAGRVGWRLVWVATRVIEGVPRVLLLRRLLLLQSWVAEEAVVEEITAAVMGVRARGEGAGVIGCGR